MLGLLASKDNVRVRKSWLQYIHKFLEILAIHTIDVLMNELNHKSIPPKKKNSTLDEK